VYLPRRLPEAGEVSATDAGLSRVSLNEAVVHDRLPPRGVRRF